MGAEHVVGLVGMLVVVGGVTAIVMVLRSESILPPMVVHPLCATCGHSQPEHSRGKPARCLHDYGHSSWNNDSYGNSQRAYGGSCDCSEFRPKDRAI
ncbi:hypothetical protein ABT096_40280 [Streptomyces sp. NPDC002561]|uniref:hypothetical protein n=1 Tax=unclassified Streptomyces TaxID=2593676 RepID=UPI00332FCEBB